MLNFSPELKMGGDGPYLFKGSKYEFFFASLKT